MQQAEPRNIELPISIDAEKKPIAVTSSLIEAYIQGPAV